MDGRLLLNAVIRPTLAWMDAKLRVPAGAKAEMLLLAIAHQESGINDRIQGIGDAGPARGFWQFERIGVQDVMQRRTRDMDVICKELVFPADTAVVWQHLAWNDMLACAVARLTLFLDRTPLPDVSDENAAWAYYVRNWRPGKPHRDRWTPNWNQALKECAPV